jgi:hypothetical protein
MAKFLLITRGGTMPASPEEGAKVMQAWGDWFTAIGGSILDPGNPISQVRIVAADGSVSPGDGRSVTGYTVVEAADIDAAVALAKGAPLSGDMSIEVGETARM